MAMRLYTPEEFDRELRNRGCEPTDHTTNTGRFWHNGSGLYFLVPDPDPDSGRYPDWMLDDLIERFGLPTVPVN